MCIWERLRRCTAFAEVSFYSGFTQQIISITSWLTVEDVDQDVVHMVLSKASRSTKVN